MGCHGEQMGKKLIELAKRISKSGYEGTKASLKGLSRTSSRLTGGKNLQYLLSPPTRITRKKRKKRRARKTVIIYR